MPDSSVAVTPGSGATIDTFTQASGDHRQAVVVGDASGAQTQAVDGTGRALVAASGASVTTPTIAALASGATYMVSVGMAGNITFWIQGANSATTAAVTTGAIVFEQSDDGNSWSPLPLMRSDTSTVVTGISGVTVAAGAALAFDGALEGVNFARARATSAASSGTQYVHALCGGMPFSPFVVVAGTTAVAGTVTANPPAITKATQGTTGVTTQDLKDAGRTPLFLQIEGASVTTTEALTAYTGFLGTTAITSSTANYTVTTGKRMRINSITLGGGGAGATVRARVRYAAGAAPSATSPALCGAVAAFASTGDAVAVPYPDGEELPAGSQIAITMVTTAAVTAWVMITGYEY